MQPVYVNPQHDDFTAGVAAFFASLGWTYLTHRYPAQAQGRLLCLLTLSGLDAWWWERYTMQLTLSHPVDSVVLPTLALKQGTIEPATLRRAVAEIWTYAANAGASVGKPPGCPTYLAAYGCTRESYVADLRAVYADEVEDPYNLPWPDRSFQLQRPIIQPVLMRQAVAIMGATAAAIERLIAQGDSHDNDRD